MTCRAAWGIMAEATRPQPLAIRDDAMAPPDQMEYVRRVVALAYHAAPAPLE